MAVQLPETNHRHKESYLPWEVGVRGRCWESSTLRCLKLEQSTETRKATTK